MTDITIISRRPDLSQAESDCVKSTLRSLTQIAGELQSYEYLITIESELKGFDDDNAIRGVLRFAVENALKILETERRHLVEISDQCARSPIPADKARHRRMMLQLFQIDNRRGQCHQKFPLLADVSPQSRTPFFQT